MTVARRFIAGVRDPMGPRGTRIGRMGVSRQSHRPPYFLLMRTNGPLSRYAHAPIRVPWRRYADPCPLASIRRHAHTPIRVPLGPQRATLRKDLVEDSDKLRDTERFR
jgi:hypothetical protein